MFAEGCRGNLGRRLEARYGLRADADPQHYGIGLKEVWQIDRAKHRAGEILHTFGWPLDAATDGGGFVYHAADERVYLGFIVGLGYENPHLDPFAEFHVVVSHALGVDFMMKGAADRNGNKYEDLVEQLVQRGVQFDVCEITLRNRKLSRDQFISYSKFVPSGVAEITRLQQQEGYAYLKP